MVQALLFVWRLFRESGRKFILGVFFVLTAFQTAFLLIQPLIVVQIVQSILSLSSGNFQLLFGCLAAFMIMTPALSWAVSIVGNLILQDVRSLARAELFNFLTHRSARFFQAHNEGQIESETATATHAARAIVYDCVLTLTRMILFILLTTCLISWIMPQYGIIFLLLSMVYLLLSYVLARKSSKYVSEAVCSTTRLSRQASDAFHNIEAIQFNNTHRYEARRLAGFLKKEKRAYLKAQSYIDRSEFFQKLLLALIFSLFIVTISFIGSQDRAATLLFYIIGLLSYNQLDNMGKTLNSLFEHCGKLKSVLDSIGYRPIHKSCDTSSSIPEAVNPPVITFKNVSFGYESKHCILSHFTKRIVPGSHVLVEGQSGAGKTTLLKLLTGELKPTQGQVLIDGFEPHRLSFGEKAGIFCLISQHATLFNRSVYENIIYGRERVDRKKIRDLLMALTLKNDPSEKQTDWLDVTIDRNGSGLSGGERKRILLARAIIASKPVLILDEATSALDSRTEQQVLDVLHRTLPDCTIIVVSHRSNVNQSGYTRIHLERHPASFSGYALS